MNNKILAIEDDPEVLALYKSYLQKRGYEVLSAAGAVEGMSLLQSNPDTRLILLDLNLPGMSGIEALKILHDDASTAHIPVVALSANATPADIEKGLNVGFYRYLTKPVKIVEFMQTLNAALDFAKATSPATTN